MLPVVDATFSTEGSPPSVRSSRHPKGTGGGRGASSNSKVLLALLLIAALGAFSPKVTVVTETRRSAHDAGVVSVRFELPRSQHGSERREAAAEKTEALAHHHRRLGGLWDRMRLGRMDGEGSSSRAALDMGGGEGTRPGDDGSLVATDADGAEGATAAGAAHHHPSAADPRHAEVDDLRISGDQLAQAIRSISEDGLLDDIDALAAGHREDDASEVAAAAATQRAKAANDWTETLNGEATEGVDRDGDAIDAFNDPAWYRGKRQADITWRDIVRLQTKALTREESSRYKNFKGHIQLDTAEAQELMVNRPRHDGDYLRVRWPPERPNTRRPVHLTLHQRQFFEDGNPGTLRLRGKVGQAQLAYLAAGKGGVPVLGKFGFDPIAVRRLPMEDVRWRYKTCAVVSNSGEMLREKRGDEIDEHEAVFRINYPPLDGYQEYVGTKTTHELVNHHHAREIALAEGYLTRRFLDPSDCSLGKYCTHAVVCIKGDCFLEPRKLPQHPPSAVVPSRPEGSRSKLVMLESMDSSGWRYTFLDAILERFPPPLATALSPDFLMAADEAWRLVSSNVSGGAVECRQVARRAEAAAERGGDGRVNHIGARSFASRIGADEGCKPSTGWFAIMLALQVCDEVDAYGFSSWKRRTSRAEGAAKYHYFDKVEGVDNIHSFDLTLRVLKTLAEHYPLRLRGESPPEK